MGTVPNDGAHTILSKVRTQPLWAQQVGRRCEAMMSTCLFANCVNVRAGGSTVCAYHLCGKCHLKPMQSDRKNGQCIECSDRAQLVSQGSDIRTALQGLEKKVSMIESHLTDHVCLFAEEDDGDCDLPRWINGVCPRHLCQTCHKNPVTADGNDMCSECKHNQDVIQALRSIASHTYTEV